MSEFLENGKLWFNGKMVNWPDAKIHVMSHVLHYGSSVFEGFRCYKTVKGPALFRLKDHIRRLFNSAKIYRIPMPYSPEVIEQACVDVVKVNNLEEAYLRPIAFRGYGSLGVDPRDTPTEVAVAALAWGKYLGDEAINIGVDVRVSSWTRMRPNTFPAMSKCGANYMNSQLINLEAKADGYIEGIALDANGFVSEGSGENIFVIRDGQIFTPPLGASILPGITRDSVMRLAHDLGYTVTEMMIPREMLYIADEVFFTGSAAEVSPIKSIDRIPVGEGHRGPITEKIQRRFFGILSGELEDKYEWLTPIN
ncbi:MAG: branched-chain amino acid transaminase [Calditrichaeota bacterium]|nr:MAG: branched-chain amino acid transaminase [Calditrichota bacterium]